MGTDFAVVGRLLSSPARAAMLEALLDGRTATASELAVAAAVKPSTASGHLAALVDGRMIAVATRGRNREYTIADRDIALALEALSRICPDRPVRSLRSARNMDALRDARTCYDHLAGRLGVDVLGALLQREWLVARGDDYVLSAAGDQRLVDIGVDVPSARMQRRHFARACLDWTERRPHLAGALGAALCQSVLHAGWVRRRRSGRGLLITPLGVDQLEEAFGISTTAPS
jgi:DNA-binding transcriptional ArsR family regulator